jgi:sporulation protein YqfC
MKRSMKNRIAESFELPKEVILDIPKIRLLGNNELYLENHKGIVEYTSDSIRINVKSGLVKISGSNLQLKEISNESVVVLGNIIGLEYIK